jgi:hypothetical protein
MTTFKRLAWVSLATVLASELDALANGSYSNWSGSGTGVSYDNSSGLYLFFAARVALVSLTPTTGAYFQLFMGASLDGTNYEDPPSSTNPGYHMNLPPYSVNTGTGTKGFGDSVWWEAPPAIVKFSALNGTGVALGTGNTVKLYGAYEQGV